MRLARYVMGVWEKEGHRDAPAYKPSFVDNCSEVGIYKRKI